jgi:hypothetical protein
MAIGFTSGAKRRVEQIRLHCSAGLTALKTVILRNVEKCLSPDSEDFNYP